jgi:hypothetical protein
MIDRDKEDAKNCFSLYFWNDVVDSLKHRAHPINI